MCHVKAAGSAGGSGGLSQLFLLVSICLAPWAGLHFTASLAIIKGPTTAHSTFIRLLRSGHYHSPWLIHRAMP